MFHPARLKSAIVASCKLPLGRPRRSLLATVRLPACVYRAREAAHRTFMANEAVALNHDAEEERVIVAVCRRGDHTKAVAARFAFHPQLLPGAAPKSHEAGFKCLRITHPVQKTEHKHFTCSSVLHNARNQAIHLVEVNRLCRVRHGLPCDLFAFLIENKKPTSDSPAGFGIS